VELSNPVDGFVNRTTKVVLQAFDQYSNLASLEAGGAVIATSGAATGGGSYTFQAGVIETHITSTVAEVVTISVTMPGRTGIDVTTTQDVVFVYPPGTHCVDELGVMSALTSC
jgi:hypothetical protein